MGTGFGTAVDLSTPGSYIHISIFQISEANFVLILVMVVLFGAALLLPFPGSRRGRHGAPAAPDAGAPGVVPPEAPALDAAALDVAALDAAAGAPGVDTSEMWTAKVRRAGLKFLPPGKLLPDTQPAYVASWVYVFGVATLAALGLAIVSGVALALGGPDWWHYDAVGHFFNSIHMWSVELFMAFMVIHLWGKFWMAAWRGKRRLTWVTGVVAFMASIVECFTGYLSQQNFDSQWISTSAKDAFNAVGVGTILRAMNFGQMLMWHIVLIPIVLVAIVGAHVLLVRVRGVSHPLPVSRPAGRAARAAAAASDAAPWRGPTRRYDILKEGTIAGLVALVLVTVLAAVLSSPDVPPVTIQSWAHATPGDFMATTAAELAGTSKTAQYGPPYNNGSASVQQIIVSWQRVAGVGQPVDAARAFVLAPLAKTPSDPSVLRALHEYQAAPKAQQSAWDVAYLKVVAHVTFANGVPSVPQAADGPVPRLIAGELAMARSGALDADLLAQQSFYGTDYTKPLLFMEDGAYFAAVASKEHLLGTQWGVMNETGSYPGQPWLWLYTMWYQLPGFRSSANVDLIAIYMTGIATVLLLAVPFIPGLRDVPGLVPVHRLVWRGWNQSGGAGSGGGPGHGPEGGAGTGVPGATPAPAPAPAEPAGTAPGDAALTPAPDGVDRTVPVGSGTAPT